MKLNWNGSGQKTYPLNGWQQPPLAMEWARGSGESLYWLKSYRFSPDKSQHVVLFLRILDDMSWQDAAPRILYDLPEENLSDA